MSRPLKQRPLGEAERLLFRLYINCRVTLAHPRQLYEEYAFTYKQLAMIAGCSLPTMERWMSREHEPVAMKTVYLRRLGEFQFLLQQYQQIPPNLWNMLCPLSAQMQSVLYSTQNTQDNSE